MQNTDATFNNYFFLQLFKKKNDVLFWFWLWNIWHQQMLNMLKVNRAQGIVITCFLLIFSKLDPDCIILVRQKDKWNKYFLAFFAIFRPDRDNQQHEACWTSVKECIVMVISRFNFLSLWQYHIMKEMLLFMLNIQLFSKLHWTEFLQNEKVCLVERQMY